MNQRRQEEKRDSRRRTCWSNSKRQNEKQDNRKNITGAIRTEEGELLEQQLENIMAEGELLKQQQTNKVADGELSVQNQERDGETG